MSDLYVCTETFTGEMPHGGSKTFHAGQDFLDAGQPDEAKLLKIWGSRFAPVRSTHAPVPSEVAAEKVKVAAKRKRVRRAKAKAAAAEAEAAPEPTPEPEPEPTEEEPWRSGGMSNARLTDEGVTL